jgi:ribosomal protein S12 methylthiotransferase
LLGCCKNQIDGEAMGGLLLAEGFTVVADPGDADAIVVNTCGFIREAVDESIEAVLSLAEFKKSGRCQKLVVTGCMAERYRNEIVREIPEADAVLGVGEFHKIAGIIKGAPAGGSGDEEAFLANRLLMPVSHTVPVRIADGCDNRCAYCAIPSIRGPYRSRPMDGILRECEGLIQRGARELVLVAQDTARYGVDLYGEPILHRLLADAAALRGLTWLRVMYAYPEHITDAVIGAVADNDKICKYLDIPVQHSHDAVLARMGRRGTGYGLRAVVARLRERIPGVALRTTVMTGFPGETEDEFAELMRFVAETGFERLGAFAYSREAGTPAARFKPQIKENVRERRRDSIMQLQREIHEGKQRALIGQTLRVMVDEGTREGGANRYEGRSYRDAPETDTMVTFTGEDAFLPGEMADVSITGCDGYDLIGIAKIKQT